MLIGMMRNNVKGSPITTLLKIKLFSVISLLVFFLFKYQQKIQTFFYESDLLHQLIVYMPF